MNPKDRRDRARLPAKTLTATLRLQYRLTRVRAPVIDFNRYGMSLRLDRPLPNNGVVHLALVCDAIEIRGIVGVIHNCRALGNDGYRCGVQFRTEAQTQLDRDQTREALAGLERLFADTFAAPTDADMPIYMKR